MGVREQAADRFGQRLKDERTRRKWSQAKLAKMLTDKGIPMIGTMIHKIEAGDRTVRIDEAAGIADLLDVSLDSLVGRRTGLANDLANVISGLQHTAGKAVMDLAALHGAVQGWFVELGDLEFDHRSEFETEGRRALDALTEAQDALWRISNFEPPKRVAMTRLDDLIERRAAEKIFEMLKEVENRDDTQSQGRG